MVSHRRKVLYTTLLVVMLLAASGASVLIPRAAAQSNVDDVRKVVQQWLLEELDKPGLILVEYTYAGTSWPDSSMGCTIPGQPITPGTVHGYRWTFTFDNMVRYEVHSGLLGTPAVLCGAVNIAPDVRMTTYTGPDFAILVPEAWLVYPTGSNAEVLFAPGPSTDCTLPGMLVTAQGRVAAGVTPDSLLDDYLAGTGLTDSPTDRQLVGTLGRTTRYETPCDGGTRVWQVAAFVQYGSAYRVLQWASGDAIAQWNERFDNMLSQFTPTSAIGGGGSTPGAAGTSPSASDTDDDLSLPALPLAIRFAGDVFLGALDDVPGRSVTAVPTFDRRYIGFSPDGLILSYIDVTNAELRTLHVVDGLSPRRIARNVDPRFPPSWALDSTRIAYVVDTGETDASGAARLAIEAVPALGGKAERLATFAYHDTCATGSPDPADDVAFAETGPGGLPNVLVWMPDDQFLVSTSCEGAVGMLNPETGGVVSLGDDLQGGVIAPDRTRFAARTPQGIAVLDFANWQRANLPVGSDAWQIAWEAGGQSLIYALETPVDSLTLDDPADRERGEAVFGRWPVEVGVYELALYRIDLTTGEETLIWGGQGRAVGRIAPAPDGSGVLFSLVPSSLLVAEVFQSGGDTLALHAAWPEPALYWLPAGSPRARLLAYAGQPAFAPVTVTDPQPLP